MLIDDHLKQVSCPDHPGEALGLFCSCGKTICNFCAASSHEGHKKAFLREVADQYRAEVAALSLKTECYFIAVLEQAIKRFGQHEAKVKKGS